jgi:hypothetical protein
LASSDSEQNPKALQAIYTQAETLKSLIWQDHNFDVRSTRNQYEALKEKLLAIDKTAKGHLPEIEYNNWDLIGSRSSARIAVSQLCAYIDAKFVEHPKKVDTQAVAGPIVNFLMMLPSYGLSIRWAVAAAMLSSLEVITNQKLAKLNLDNSGEFDKRLNKLNMALKERGIEIPALLLSGLYKARSKVVHEGKEPTTEEMTTIFDLITSLHEKAK